MKNIYDLQVLTKLEIIKLDLFYNMFFTMIKYFVLYLHL